MLLLVKLSLRTSNSLAIVYYYNSNGMYYIMTV